MTWPRSKPYRSGRGACPNRPTHQAVARDGLLDAVLVLRPTEAAGAPPAAARRRGRTAILAEGYGLSEAFCASARSFPEAPRPHSVGQCPPYQQMRVVRAGADGTWEDVPAGERGLLAISGPTVFRGYVTGRGENGRVLRCRR